MNLLIALLIYLGANIIPDNTGNYAAPNPRDANVQEAQFIIDNGLCDYHCDDDGIIIIDDVSPH